jgi:hypothetical protein
LLAPEVVEAILGEQADHAPVLEQLERPLPMSWDDQRCLLSAASTSITGTM